jgi:hypothetical protein
MKMRFRRNTHCRRDTAATIELIMQKASLIISLIAFGLMVGGLVDAMVSAVPLTQATTVLPVFALLHFTQAPFGLVAMSAGIILLALLPGVRVIMGLYLAVRRRHLGDALVALIVLLELLLSMRGER